MNVITFILLLNLLIEINRRHFSTKIHPLFIRFYDFMVFTQLLKIGSRQFRNENILKSWDVY